MDGKQLKNISKKGCRAMPSKRTDVAERRQRKSPGKLSSLPGLFYDGGEGVRVRVV